MAGELEPGEAGKMWCYCCEKEVLKHVTDGQTSIEWAGLLEHMTGLVQWYLLYCIPWPDDEVRTRSL
jgi:hypothetical protein